MLTGDISIKINMNPSHLAFPMRPIYMMFYLVRITLESIMSILKADVSKQIKNVPKINQYK